MRTITETVTRPAVAQSANGSSAGTSRQYSSLEEELARRRADVGAGQRRTTRLSDPARYRSARQRVRQRLERQRRDGQLAAAPVSPRWVGRWTPVHRFGILGRPVPEGERAGRQARQLLARYGVVTRESLEGENGAWDWPLIYRYLQRMELRGELRRGYFVQGLPGLQFALPDVVERLRALRDRTADDNVVVMSACDPANLYGPTREDGPISGSGEPLAFSRLPSTWLVQHRGLPLLVASSTGADLTTVQGADEGLLQRAIGALLDHLAGFERRVTVETWNGDAVLESPGAPLLETQGFRRSYPSMIWDRGV